MLAATRDSVPSPPPPATGLRVVLFTAAFCAWVVAGTPGLSRAADSVRDDGLFISVPNPITEGVVTRIRNQIEDARARHKKEAIRKIIFDFNPTDTASATPNFYVCLEFADYLVRLKNIDHVYTVAYVHNPVTRHTVLPVLACTDLVMSENGALGDVQSGKGERLAPSARGAYERFAKLRYPLSPDLVLKMLDRDMAILRGKTRNGVTRYVGYVPGDPRRSKEAVLKQAQASPEGFRDWEEAPGLEPGTSLYKATAAVNFGLCSRDIINSRERVVSEYGLSPATLREDVLQGRTIHPWLLDFSGSVTESRVNSLKRKIEKAVSKGANFIILQLDCEGGDTQAARDFATYLRNLKDDKGVLPVKTVAFIPPGRALGAATAVALGCNEIVMAKTAVLGDFSYLKDKKPDDYNLMRKALVGLAKEQWYSPLLIQGMVDPNLVIVMVRSKADPTYHFLVSEDELKKDEESAKPRWDRENVVKNKGELLKLDAERAYQYGVARRVVDDLDGLYRYYDVKPEEVRRSGSDLLDEIETFFQNPFVRIMLVMIGIIGLILEMKMPGVGLPGVVAAVCFVLFFWANSSIGQFTWLAILLFALGLILIGLEVFVLPGMAVFGISGVVLVVSSLVLVTLEKAPTTSRDWWSLGLTLTTYTFSLIGALVGAFLIARYLPQIPYANRLMLTPPGEDGPEGGPSRAPLGGVENAAALLGAIGEAATTLRPAGKARIGDQYLDVIAEGSYVNAGQRVQVIEIEGNRIVVKEVT